MLFSPLPLQKCLPHLAVARAAAHVTGPAHEVGGAWAVGGAGGGQGPSPVLPALHIGVGPEGRAGLTWPQVTEQAQTVQGPHWQGSVAGEGGDQSLKN